MRRVNLSKFLSKIATRETLLTLERAFTLAYTTFRMIMEYNFYKM